MRLEHLLSEEKQKDVPRRSSAQAKQLKEHLLSEEDRKRCSRYYQEHLLSEENYTKKFGFVLTRFTSSCLQDLFYINSSVAQLVRAPH